MLADTERINRIKDRMKDSGQSIAVAESVTAGFLQAALASAEKAMEVFQGGLTAYNLGQKCLQLGVNPIQAQRCNCVSEQTAEEMATGIAARFLATWGIGVTGYATPTPDSDGRVFALAAFCFEGKILRTMHIPAEAKTGEDAQQHYVERILEQLEELQEGLKK